MTLDHSCMNPAACAVCLNEQRRQSYNNETRRTRPAPPVPGGASGERCVHCGQTPSDPGASMCQIDGVSTGKLHDFRPGGGTGQRPGGWVEGIGWVAKMRDLAPSDRVAGASGSVGRASTQRLLYPWTVATVVRWADGQIPSPPASPVPPTPTPQPDGELRAEISVLVRALWQACHDGWADGDSAMAGYLNHARTVLADDYEDPTPTPPSTPAEQPQPDGGA